MFSGSLSDGLKAAWNLSAQNRVQSLAAGGAEYVERAGEEQCAGGEVFAAWGRGAAGEGAVEHAHVGGVVLP